jgi:hypothetical protein
LNEKETRVESDTSGGNKSECEDRVGKPEGKRSLRRWEDNIKMDFKNK